MTIMKTWLKELFLLTLGVRVKKKTNGDIIVDLTGLKRRNPEMANRVAENLTHELSRDKRVIVTLYKK